MITIELSKEQFALMGEVFYNAWHDACEGVNIDGYDADDIAAAIIYRDELHAFTAMLVAKARELGIIIDGCDDGNF